MIAKGINQELYLVSTERLELQTDLDPVSVKITACPDNKSFKSISLKLPSIRCNLPASTTVVADQ